MKDTVTWHFDDGGRVRYPAYDENRTNRRIVGGIAHEIRQRLVAGGFGTANAYGVWFEVEGLKLVLEQMAAEAGVGLLYHTFFCDTLMKNRQAVGAVVQNKGGRFAIRAKRIIDCTGDGDVAFRAGCPQEVGRPSDGRCQPVTLMFTMGGVDWPKVQAFDRQYREQHPDDTSPWQLRHVWDTAIANGDMRPFQRTRMGWWWTPTRPDQVGVNFTHMIHVDATKAEDLTAATVEGRQQAYETIDVYRKNTRYSIEPRSAGDAVTREPDVPRSIPEREQNMNSKQEIGDEYKMRFCRQCRWASFGLYGRREFGRDCLPHRASKG